MRTAEHEVLVNLRRDPGIAQHTLTRRCFNAKSHTSALLTSLEERGWVRREADPAEARAKKLFLTPAGERMATRTAAVQAEVASAMAETVSPKALGGVTTAMGKIASGCRGCWISRLSLVDRFRAVAASQSIETLAVKPTSRRSFNRRLSEGRHAEATRGADDRECVLPKAPRGSADRLRCPTRVDKAQQVVALGAHVNPV